MRLNLSKPSLFFCGLFGILTATALAHDIYIWQRDGNIFSFADLGGIFKRYLPEEFKATVDFLGPENFNILLTPVLSQPATVLFGALLVVSFLLGVIFSRLAARHTPAQNQAMSREDRNNRKGSMSLKDQVKYRVR